MSKQGAQRGVGKGSGRALSLEAVRSLLAERLRERLPQLKTAIATRVYAISDPRDVSDPAYVQGLNAALAAAVEYRLEVLEVGERRAPEVPAELLAQARLDARDRVPLDTVLRRYFAGNALFADFLAEEAEREGVPNAVLRNLLAAQATVGDRLLAAVSAEHAREAQVRPSGTAERRRESVKRLLAGEFVDHAELEYDLEAQHLALMAKGEGAESLLRELAKRLDRRLLAVKREEEPVWAAWLGGGSRLESAEAGQALADLAPKGVFVALGEPAEGLAGWRFSHLQAKAALAVAERSGAAVARYGEVAIEAAVLRDDLLARSLRQLYLEPLEGMRDGGKVARETLRAYFAAERNVSSTAAALGVDRRTVRNRIRAIEELVGRPLSAAAADLEIALRLADAPFPD
ncbi:MAG TPA: helix-turn-helix domain-containing protein [Solirubrobacterales bacterium]|nr:helix-turn-helix domain-containing protein [Solirubrobacterales bacterium]